MAVSNGVVKQTAKTALKGKYINGIFAAIAMLFVCLIGYIASSLVGMVGGSLLGYIFSAALLAFLIFPFLLGVVYFFRRAVWGENDSLMTIFHYFSCRAEYIRAAHLSLLLALRAAALGVVFLLPSLIVELFASNSFYGFFNIPMPSWTSGLWIFSTFLKALGVIALLVVMCKYHLSAFLLAADEQMDAAEALHFSVMISRRTLGDFLWLVVSVLHYLLLNLLVIPAIFTLPYIFGIYIVFCRFSVAEYNKELDKAKTKSAPSFEVSDGI